MQTSIKETKQIKSKNHNIAHIITKRKAATEPMFAGFVAIHTNFQFHLTKFYIVLISEDIKNPKVQYHSDLNTYFQFHFLTNSTIF